MHLDNFEQVLFLEIWKSLSYFDLISLALTSKYYLQLLYAPSTWIYLLSRDFSLVATENFSQKLLDLYEYKYFLPDSFLSSPSHDKILKHRLYRFIYDQPCTNITYWCFNKNCQHLLMATITGVNIYEVILKYIIHIELPQLNIPAANITTSLWKYLKTYDCLYPHIESKSLGDVLNKLIPLFTSSNYNPYLVRAIPISTF